MLRKEKEQLRIKNIKYTWYFVLPSKIRVFSILLALVYWEGIAFIQ